MKLCVIPGDGIGPEVIAAALRVLRVVAPQVELAEGAAGWDCFQATGSALPEATLALARACDAVLFGAVASPSHPVDGYRSPIVALRRELDLYANIRPVSTEYRVLSAESGNTQHSALSTQHSALSTQHSALSTQHSALSTQHSLVVVRENTEGLYAGRERLEDGGNTAIAERVITRRSSERIARVAFELARARSQGSGVRVQGSAGERQTLNPEPRTPKVTIVHKANVLRITDGLFRAVALEVARDYPEVAVEELLVDTAAMHLARSPERFDVIVTTNMFGDILSDVACIHGGGLGLASSANLGERQALFEPVHGAAPDIAGKGVANPLAAIGCVGLLLEWAIADCRLQIADCKYSNLQSAMAQVLRDGPHTPDMGGSTTTEEVTDAVIEQLRNA